MKRRNINLTMSYRDGFSILMAVLLLFPPLMTAISNQMIGSTKKWLIFFALTLFLGVLGVQQHGKILISREQKTFLCLWGVVYVKSLIRNGDFGHGNYIDEIWLFLLIISTSIFVMNRRYNEKIILGVMLFYLVIQMALGYYFYFSPDVLSGLGTSLFGLEDIWLTKFYNAISDGCFMGLVTHYSTSGCYMSILTILLFAKIFTSKIKTNHIGKLDFVLLVFAVVALILTQKRAHLLFTGFAVIWMYFVAVLSGDFKKRIFQITSAIVFIALGLYLLFSIPAFSSTIKRFVMGQTLTEMSSGRIDTLWIPAISAFNKEPFFGIGWRQFKYQYPQYQIGSGLVNNDTHNIYLQLLCENGILLGGYILLIMILMYIRTWKLAAATKKRKECADVSLLFSFGFQTFFLLYGLTGNPLYDSFCMFPYLLCCGISLKRRQN